MDNTKAFYIVNTMIAEHEDFIEKSQLFIKENKGNQKLKDEVQRIKIEVQEHKKMVKPLYRINNAFYGV